MSNTHAAAGGTPASEPPVRRDAAQIRPAQVGDVKVLHQFVVELAETEQFPGEVTAESGDLERALFGEDAVAEAVVATIGAEPVGFALYYSSYSTILGRPGLHLEDLYVRAEHRGSGLGQALLAHLAREAVDRGCGRLIEVMRLEGAPLEALATSSGRCNPVD